MPQTVNLKNWSWMVLWWPTRPPRTDTKRRCPLHDRGLECKSRKSRDIQSNRHGWPWSAKWSMAKANRILAWKCTSHNKHPLPATQETTLHMDITRWSIPKSIDYIFCSRRWSTIWSAKSRLEADCDSYYELLIAKFRLKLKKVGKTTKLFRYDLNQIPYDYTVEWQIDSRD